MNFVQKRNLKLFEIQVTYKNQKNQVEEEGKKREAKC